MLQRQSRREFTFAMAAGLLAGMSGASAQALSDGPVRIVVPYAPGSTVDFALRLVGEKVAQAGGPQIVLEHKTGGSGVVGTMAVKQAIPDGRTLILCDLSTFGVNLSLVPNLPYDPLTDFKPIAPLWFIPSVMAVPANLAANSVPELVALAKNTPGGLNYGSQGVGSGGHIRGEILKKVSGAPFVHVPYRGAPPAVTDLVAGRIAFLMGAYGSVQGHVAGKQLKILGTSARKRLPVLPDVPTLGEVGYPEVDLETWFGLAAPAGTPDAAITALSGIFAKAVSDADVEAKFNSQGIYGMKGSPAEFTTLIKADTARLKPLIEGIAVK